MPDVDQEMSAFDQKATGLIMSPSNGTCHNLEMLAKEDSIWLNRHKTEVVVKVNGVVAHACPERERPSEGCLRSSPLLYE